MYKGIRLLFGNIPDFDHKEYYFKCERSRTYNKHIIFMEYGQQEHTVLKKILKFDALQSIKIVSDSALKMKNFV